MLGGGVAGMSAAHELAERGLEVHVYEAKRVAGGKARSIFVPGTGADGRRDLPGEHGFRFFPSFYRHLPDTMKRIPFAHQANGVFDNLVPTSRSQIARKGATEIDVVPRFPRTIDDLVTMFKMVFGTDFGIPDEDFLFFGQRLLVLLTSCTERRFGEYENLAWWDFVDAKKRSDKFRQYLCDVAVRSLVAMKPQIASTRTVGNIGLQLWLDHAKPGTHVDRLLNGPTHDVWITPWLSHLENLGVVYHRDTRVVRLDCDKKRITNVVVADAQGQRDIQADFYVAAVPVEAFDPLVSDAMKLAEPQLANLGKLHTDWMIGLQYFLDTDVEVAPGHIAFVDAPWALTAISQQQFWPNTDLSRFGDGRVRGVLSVVISDWDRPGRKHGKAARDCTRAEILDEVWSEMAEHLNDQGKIVLDAKHRHSEFIADSLELAAGGASDHEPLLVNTVGSWWHRPEAGLPGIENLFLASDYVRTNTDLATMEGANEAARRATNAILDAIGSGAQRCEIWELEEPPMFAPFRALDQMRMRMGLPHALALPPG